MFDFPFRDNFGPYKLVNRIAIGGMAEIYLALFEGVGGYKKYLALKVIHPKYSHDTEFVEMLVNEAKITVQLNHPNLGEVFDLGKLDDTYYIAMEYIHGRDLFNTLVKASELELFLPFDVAASIAAQTALGLNFAHSYKDAAGKPLNIIHRDISPQNIMVTFNGDVKIVDFGIAKANVKRRETEVGIIKGKFYYMSPEQAAGRAIDHRTDIFSLGICLYEILTGEMLYPEDNPINLLNKVREAKIDSPKERRPSVPEELAAITMKALAKNPKNRFQTGDEFAQALQKFIRNISPNFDRVHTGHFLKKLYGDIPHPGDEPVKSEPVQKAVSLIRESDYDPQDTNSIIYNVRAYEQRKEKEGRQPSENYDAPDEEDSPEEAGNATTVINWERFEELRRLGLLPDDTETDNPSTTTDQNQEAQVVHESDNTPELLNTEESQKENINFTKSPIKPVIKVKPQLNITTQPEPETPPLHFVPTSLAKVPVKIPPAEQAPKPEIIPLPANKLSTSTKLLLIIPLFPLLLIALLLGGALYKITRDETGNLKVTSQPSGAKITLNGEELDDKTPYLIEDLKIAEYEISLSYPGYFDAKQTILLQKDNTIKAELSLQPIPGTIVITSDPTGAEVRLDGQKKGKTPLKFETNRQDNSEELITLHKTGYVVEKVWFQWEKNMFSFKKHCILRPEPN